ncbi:MAG: hypothetical protein AB7H93_21970 [Vicinamibacterales bacterium]
MDEQQLRALVRDAIARHLGPATPPAVAMTPAPAAPPAAGAALDAIAIARFHVARPAGEVECVIEPTVTCNHCGHCLCYGH